MSDLIIKDSIQDKAIALAKNTALDATVAYMSGYLISQIHHMMNAPLQVATLGGDKLPSTSQQVALSWALYFPTVRLAALPVEKLTNYTLSTLTGNTIKDSLFTKLFSYALVSSSVHHAVHALDFRSYWMMRDLWPAQMAHIALATLLVASSVKENSNLKKKQ